MMRLLTAVDERWLYFSDHNVAIALIHSPCPISRVEVFSERYGYRWMDVTNKYDEYIQKKGNNMSKTRRIKTAPMFDVGEVIDLSYKHGGMPNRICIKSVSWREQDTQWMYNVVMENSGEDTDMAEDFIKDRKASMTSAVYSNPEIAKRINEGWRFCGNFDSDSANANAKLISANDNIKSVRLYPAINYRNQFINGQMGIWVRYVNMIADNGQPMRYFDDFVDIK